MSKYDALKKHLSTSREKRIRMSFAAIEKVLGVPLPPSKRHQAWWSNNPSNNVMTRAWLGAGFRTEEVDVAGEKVTFVRAGRLPTPPSAAHQDKGGAERYRSLLGCMKGTTIVMPGVDLTEPADPEWGRVYEDPESLSGRVDKIRADTRLSSAEKIRALNELRVPRAEIARMLGKRYQHVRSVLTAR